MSLLQNRLKKIRNNIAQIVASEGRLLNDISLMVVSKTQSQQAIEEAHSYGCELFGENRVQEARDKFVTSGQSAEGIQECSFRKNVAVHLIGSLQKNKVKSAMRIFDCIQSVDSIELIHALHTSFDQLELSYAYPVFLQVRSSDFDYKHGFFEYNTLQNAAEEILKKGTLRIQGVMTIAPFSNDEYIVRKAFECTRIYKERLEKDFLLENLELSMGMSSDYELAIKEGSNLLRLGSAVFGIRT